MSDQNNSTNPAPSANQPGLVAAHVEYIKGAGESVIGNLMGSHAWTTTGEQDKAHAQSTMKAAAENRDPATQGYGRAEELAGKAFGCQGMQQEGVASANAKKD
ncbi:hypothetical protein F5X68DRAFT_250749 [Plectosphaerella plurivora]|uniref:Uncharacterized protein n=1 Tax=Plectosphaerella plurivora TaxID=936078 RepID=A0A9P8VHZ8_9PEZI|nr:hypothetical protein F5X68DRAFT_250749 [Plectosphaerella plurivora]